MMAKEHTRAMLRWWRFSGVTSADLAVRRSDGTMIWHRDLQLNDLPLSWARAENVRCAEVYIRPARGYSWPLVFLDDLPVADALAITQKYDALVVKTSPKGGCHLWLTCANSLNEGDRHNAQRWLAQRVGADPASTSGEHLGRLAGFRNFKREGVWVNVLADSRRGGSWIVKMDKEQRSHSRKKSTCLRQGQPDCSPSAKEWGWVCGMLEAGFDPVVTYQHLVEQASSRRGKDAERYARHTIKRALAHIRQPLIPT